jgi:hypothetical protein
MFLNLMGVIRRNMAFLFDCLSEDRKVPAFFLSFFFFFLIYTENYFLEGRSVFFLILPASHGSI